MTKRYKTLIFVTPVILLVAGLGFIALWSLGGQDAGAPSKPLDTEGATNPLPENTQGREGRPEQKGQDRIGGGNKFSTPRGGSETNPNAEAQLSIEDMIRMLGEAGTLQQAELDALTDSIVSKGDEALFLLSGLLDGTQDEVVEQSCIMILRRIKSQEAQSILQKTITDSENTEKTREQAIIAAADFRTKEMYDFLVQYANNEKNGNLRYAARTATMHIRKYTPGLIQDKGNVSLTIAGDLKVGGRIIITATAKTAEDSEKAFIWIDLPQAIKPIAPQERWKGKLTAGESRDFVVEAVVSQEGVWPISGKLRANFERGEQELHNVTKYLVVTKTSGQALDVPPPLPNGEKQEEK